MVSVAVSKLGKTDLVFVQPGAKINSVYYSHNVLEQGLLPDIRRSSNDNFLFQQDGAPANSPDLNPVDYSVCGSVATDSVSSQNFALTS